MAGLKALNLKAIWLCNSVIPAYPQGARIAGILSKGGGLHPSGSLPDIYRN
jgi:hypothetical protein